MATTTKVESYCDCCGAERLPFSVPRNPEYMQADLTLVGEWVSWGISGDGDGHINIKRELCKNCTNAVWDLLKELESKKDE